LVIANYKNKCQFNSYYFIDLQNKHFPNYFNEIKTNFSLVVNFKFRLEEKLKVRFLSILKPWNYFTTLIQSFHSVKVFE
jgi:hypothetical protein